MQSFEHRPNLFKFFSARALRIFPALGTVVLLSVFVLGTLLNYNNYQSYILNPHTWRYLVCISLFKLQFDLPGVFENNIYPSVINGSIWSLAYEWVMYCLLFGFGFIGLMKKNLLSLLANLLLVAVTIFLNESNRLPNMHFAGIEFGRVTALYSYFFIGALLYIWRKRIRMNTFVALAMLFIWSMTYYSVYFNYLSYLFVPYLTIWAAQLPMPAFVKAITKSGDYSYGLYVYGWPIQQCIVLYFGNQIGLWPMFGLSIICTLPFAIASYHWIEAPALQLKPS